MSQKKQQYKNSGLGDSSRETSSGGVVCYYCHKLGHVIRDCKKRKNRNQRFPFAHKASTTEASDQSVQFTTDKLAKFHLYQESLKSPSTPITAIAKLGNPNKCFVPSSSFEWVIDSRATYHMMGNFSLFSTFQSHSSTSSFTLADGSQSCVLRLDTIFPTPSLPLSFVLSLPNFSFNLISMSKLTRALKCYISFFPGFSLL